MQLITVYIIVQQRCSATAPDPEVVEAKVAVLVVDTQIVLLSLFKAKLYVCVGEKWLWKLREKAVVEPEIEKCWW